MNSKTSSSHSILKRTISYQDEKIWSALKEGDRRALSQLYSKYFDNLYNYGSRITKDQGLTEDSIQDLFIEFWNKRETLSEVQHIKSYLYKCLRRKIIYKLSIQARHPEPVDLTSFEIQLSDKTHYLNQQIKTDIKKRLLQLIESLSAKQKEAIFLIYYDQLSYEDVSIIMGLKVKTVYNLIHLAISKLREQKSGLSFHTFSQLVLI